MPINAPTLAPPNRAQFFNGINGLRAFAMILVIGFHSKLLPGGYAGVDIFFVISGFLMAKILLGTEFEKYSFWRFINRRFWRIWPLLAFVSLSYSILIVLFFGADPASEFLPAITFTANLTKSTFGTPLVLGPTWSLATEFQFYVLIAITFWAIRGRHNLFFAWAAILFMATTASKFLGIFWDVGCGPLAFSPVFRSSGLFLGILVAFAPRMSAQIPRWFAAIGLMVYFVIIFSETWCMGAVTAAITILAELISASIILAVINSDQKKGPSITSRLVYWTGNLSYGAYLWHFPMLILISHFSQGEKFVIMLIGSLLLSFFSFHLIEMRFYKPAKYSTRNPFSKRL